MANRFWVGGTGSWDASTKTHWAATSGGAGGQTVPTAADAVIFDGNSGTGAITISITPGLPCASLVTTGYTGTVAGTGPLNIGTTSAGAFTIGSGTTWSYTGVLTFVSTSTHTLTSNGKVLDNLTINGSGVTVTLGGALTITNNLSHILGTFATANFALTMASYENTGSGTRVLTLGTSTVNLNGGGTSETEWITITPSGFTVTANTATINLVNTSDQAIFYGAGKTWGGTINIDGTFGNIGDAGNTFGTVNFNSMGLGIQFEIDGANTFTNLHYSPPSSGANSVFEIFGNITVSGTFTVAGSPTFRVSIISDTPGTQRTLTSNGTLVFSYVDISDMVGAGTNAWNLSAITGGSGDYGNNTGITFTTGANMYWHQDTGDWTDISKWFLATNGGGGAGRVPFPQDAAVFDANSFSTSGQTVTLPNSGNIGALDTSAATHSPTFDGMSQFMIIRGSWDLSGVGSFLASGIQLSSAISVNFKGCASSLPPMAIGAGTLSLTGDLVTVAFQVVGGSFVAGVHNITTAGAALEALSGASINLGSGTWTLNSNDADPNSSGATLILYNDGSSTITTGTATFNLTDTTSNDKTIVAVNATLPTVSIASGGTGVVNITNALIGGAPIAISNLTIAGPKTVVFASGQTLTCTTFSAVGTAGNLVTMGSDTPGTAWLLSVASGNVACDYLSLQDSHASGGATFYAGSHSTNVSGNTGWSFTSAPSAGSVLSIAPHAALAGIGHTLTNGVVTTSPHSVLSAHGTGVHSSVGTFTGHSAFAAAGQGVIQHIVAWLAHGGLNAIGHSLANSVLTVAPHSTLSAVGHATANSVATISPHSVLSATGVAIKKFVATWSASTHLTAIGTGIHKAIAIWLAHNTFAGTGHAVANAVWSSGPHTSNPFHGIAAKRTVATWAMHDSFAGVTKALKRAPVNFNSRVSISFGGHSFSNIIYPAPVGGRRLNDLRDVEAELKDLRVSPPVLQSMRKTPPTLR